MNKQPTRKDKSQAFALSWRIAKERFDVNCIRHYEDKEYDEDGEEALAKCSHFRYTAGTRAQLESAKEKVTETAGTDSSFQEGDQRNEMVSREECGGHRTYLFLVNDTKK